MDKERDKIINQFESVKLTRRQSLKYLGAVIFCGSMATGNLGILAYDVFKGKEVDSELDKNFPPPSEDADLNDKYKNFQNQIVDLAAMGQWDEVEKVIKSEEFVKVNSSRIQQEVYPKAREIKRKDILKDKTIISKNEYSSTGNILGTMIGGAIAALALTIYVNDSCEEIKKAKEGAEKRLSFYEKMFKGKKSAKEIVAFDSKLHYLAPLGGKIYSTKENGYHGALDPTLSAEEQLETVKELRRNGDIREHYIHQLTVQGKLPDQFKFAAIALILHSPFLYDWNQPFFEAEWGKIGPLIHDGGYVNTELNPVWKNVKGRTDFLQRAFINNATELGALERMTPEELVKEPVDKLDKARRDQLEEERIGLEGKFYQRVASTLHAKIGTMPNKIPKNVRKGLALVWEKFELNIRLLLNEYDLDGAGNVAWFLDKPTNRGTLSRYGKRYEADWEPIKQELIKFEQIRQQHPEIRPKVNQILTETVENVDRIIGLS